MVDIIGISVILIAIMLGQFTPSCSDWHLAKGQDSGRAREETWSVWCTVFFKQGQMSLV
jgi:hypothetical protein